jgi:acetyltransferase
MIENVDYQLIVGSQRDKDFGSFILFGMGGRNADLIRDFSSPASPQPHTRQTADGRDEGIQPDSGVSR